LHIKYLYSGKLKPRNAVCAIIFFKKKFLLQKRDNKKNIFFPDHIGLFGGAVDKFEANISAIQREIKEELNLSICKKRFKYFSSLILDFSKVGYKKYTRTIYTLQLKKEEIAKIKLYEGKYLLWTKFFDTITKMILVPYDAFALWLFLFQKKIK
jgi:8-oxo-dGTP pyrophosphatase MutT (NUDIX family)